LISTVAALRGGVSQEYLGSYENLAAWARQAGVVPDATVRELLRAAQRHPQLAARALSRAREVREAIYALFSAEAKGASAAGAALDTLNAALAEALANTRIAAGDGGYRWRLAVDEPALDQPLWAVVRDAADLLTSERRELVGECGGETCSWLFLDTTRNHSRQWCNMKGCGNRAKVRRHRAKHAHGL
jgi:predicted RNA-binding Zn ribbon-like protein